MGRADGLHGVPAAPGEGALNEDALREEEVRKFGPVPVVSPRPQPKSQLELLLGLLLLVVLFGGCVAWLMKPESLESQCESMAYEAYQWVNPRLKAPATARYGRPVAVLDGRTCVVDNYVDSQNSFGATIRTHFVLSMVPTGDGKWRLTDLRFR